jgi:NADPH:quinone reductase-like Zn-dependent oxidoreductase
VETKSREDPMKAAILTELGRPPSYGELPEPAPGEGEVVAEVRAAALKNIERALADGSHYASARLPLPGQVGLDAVVRLPDGRRMYTGARPPGGAMAELMAVDPRTAVELPAGVDDAEAAALPNAGMSAWFALEYTGAIQPGQSVLVLGATGVTGSLAVQLAKHRFGAGRVVAAGRNAARLDRLVSLGADTTIRLGPDGIADEVRRLHAERPFDLVVDYLWGSPAEQTLRALANDDLAAEFHRTRYAQVGEMAGPSIDLPASVLRSAGIELVGQGGGSVPKEAFGRVVPEILPALFALLADREIGVDTSVRPLAEVTDAWTAPAPSGVRVVLTP